MQSKLFKCSVDIVKHLKVGLINHEHHDLGEGGSGGVASHDGVKSSDPDLVMLVPVEEQREEQILFNSTFDSAIAEGTDSHSSNVIGVSLDVLPVEDVSQLCLQDLAVFEVVEDAHVMAEENVVLDVKLLELLDKGLDLEGLEARVEVLVDVDGQTGLPHKVGVGKPDGSFGELLLKVGLTTSNKLPVLINKSLHTINMEGNRSE